MSKMKMQYLNERGAQYWFPKQEIIDFYKRLPSTDYVDHIYAHCERRILVITHDDLYDPSTIEIEEEFGIKATHFLLSYQIKPNPPCDDLQLHFDKGYGSLQKQIKQFTKILRKVPWMNRNHRLWWRSDNIDLAYLALHGIRIDSSKIGITPYLPCIEGKLLPIWEVPFCLYDLSARYSLYAAYSKARSPEELFKKRVTPLVALVHPLIVAKRLGIHFRLKELILLGQQYGYEFMTMSEFYAQILKPQEPLELYNLKLSDNDHLAKNQSK